MHLKILLDSYHWKYPTSNSNSMYLLTAYSWKQIHQSWIQHKVWNSESLSWRANEYVMFSMYLYLLTAWSTQQIHWKLYIKVKFDVRYFQSMTLKIIRLVNSFHFTDAPIFFSFPALSVFQIVTWLNIFAKNLFSIISPARSVKDGLNWYEVSSFNTLTRVAQKIVVATMCRTNLVK